MDGREALRLAFSHAEACAVCSAATGSARAYVAQLERERDEFKARAEKAELRTLSLYTPLWEYGYDCNDYEAQAIVGEALQARSDLAALRAQPCSTEHPVTIGMAHAGACAAQFPVDIYSAMEHERCARVAAASTQQDKE